MKSLKNYVAVITALFLAASVSSTAMAALKCSDAALLSDLGVDLVQQFSQAHGEIIAPRIGAQIGTETQAAVAQIRVLETSSVRNYQLRAAHEISDQVVLANPQLVQISGAGLMRPLLLALPKVIDLTRNEDVVLERRMLAGDPSQNNRDILISSMSTSDSVLRYEERQIRNRAGAAPDTYEVMGTVERIVEMHGGQHGNRFLATDVIITIQDLGGGQKRMTQIKLQPERPIVLLANASTSK